MLISAVQPFTMIDFPNHISCIIFTAGCDFRCGYCHNSEFVLPDKIKKIAPTFIQEAAVFHFLEKRKRVLDGVVISGGEPTMQSGLISFMSKVKSMGYTVKLDTNGNNPERLEKILSKNIVDYVAMDIKTSLDRYQSLCGRGAWPDNIKRSITMLLSSSVDYEFRTTLIREIHTSDVLESMASLLVGAHKIFLQQFRPQETLCSKFADCHPFTQDELDGVVQLFKKKNIQAFVR